jgi:hypothetical protein
LSLELEGLCLQRIHDSPELIDYWNIGGEMKNLVESKLAQPDSSKHFWQITLHYFPTPKLQISLI